MLQKGDRLFFIAGSKDIFTIHGLHGFILLTHTGIDPARTDKFYYGLDALIRELKKRGYWFVKINELLN